MTSWRGVGDTPTPLTTAELMRQGLKVGWRSIAAEDLVFHGMPLSFKSHGIFVEFVLRQVLGAF